MKVRITTHPIDFKVLDLLKINNTSIVDNRRVGSVLTRLAKKGYTNMHISFWDEHDHNEAELQIHCKMDYEEWEKYQRKHDIERRKKAGRL